MSLTGAQDNVVAASGGVVAALGCVALLVIAPLVLSVILAGAIALISAAHLVIAVAARAT